MRKQIYKNQTFSLPVDLSKDLHSFVKRREMSQFVANAIRKELEAKKKDLEEAYLAANDDEGQKEAIKYWIGTIADGADEW